MTRDERARKLSSASRLAEADVDTIASILEISRPEAILVKIEASDKADDLRAIDPDRLEGNGGDNAPI